MEFVNIFFATHPEDNTKKPYLFECPTNKEVHRGVAYMVKCRPGVKKVIAVTDSMMFPKLYVNQIMPIVGATYLAPLRWGSNQGYHGQGGGMGVSKPIKAYLAGGIFFYGDYLRNMEWARKIREAIPGIDLYSPVENIDINGVEGKKKFAGSQMIAEADNARLDESDILIACIDGDVLPSGTCAEIGKFHEKIRRGDNKLLIGICTDNRQCFLTHSKAKDRGGAESLGEQQYSYQNLYVTGLIKDAGWLVSDIDDVIMLMQQWCAEEGYNVDN